MIRRRIRTWSRVLGFLLVLYAAFRFTECDPLLFWERRAHLTDIVVRMFPLNWSYVPRIFLPLWYTLQMSVTGTGLGAVLALVAAPWCAGNLSFPAVSRKILRILIQILRSFPALILALLATFLFGLGSFAGTAALTVYTFAILTRLNYEDIENTETGSYQALCAMGVTPVRAYFRAIVPEIAPSCLTNVLYLLETNVRHSSILGYVGAGGIGLLLNEKISWLEYDKVGMILFLLFLTAGVIELSSHGLAQLVRGERAVGRRFRHAMICGLGLLFLLCTVTVQPPDFTRTSPAAVRRMIGGLFQPDWNFFLDMSSSGVGYLLLETVCISLVGTFVGAVLAVPLAFLNTSRFVPKPAAACVRIVIMAIRSVPFLIYGLIFIRVSGPGAFTGVLTLGVCSVGLLSKRFTEAIESLDFRPYDALAAMGVPALLRIRYAILPELFPAFASAILYRFDVNIREASVLGLVGAGGIGAPLIFAMNQYAWNEAGAIALGLVLLVWLVDCFSSEIRKEME